MHVLSLAKAGQIAPWKAVQLGLAVNCWRAVVRHDSQVAAFAAGMSVDKQLFAALSSVGHGSAVGPEPGVVGLDTGELNGAATGGGLLMVGAVGVDEHVKASHSPAF
jgi:hypothetical protein